jgi:hypothetical protein
MAAQDDNAPRPGSFGWTAMHSWIFIAIIAAGLLIVVVQNRYHYISPLGLGKAYRIDKLFGGIQEFDPDKGWVKAIIQNPPGPSPSVHDAAAHAARTRSPLASSRDDDAAAVGH